MNLRSKYMLGGGVALLLLVAGGLAVGGGLGAHSAADHMKRGVAALDAGDPRTARIELMNAIKADPKSGAAHLTQAKVMVALGDGVSAANEVQRAAALGRGLRVQGLVADDHAVLVGAHFGAPHPERAAQQDGVSARDVRDGDVGGLERPAGGALSRRMEFDDLSLVALAVAILGEQGRAPGGRCGERGQGVAHGVSSPCRP